MKINDRSHLNGSIRFLPNGAIHVLLIIILPVYIIIGLFSCGLIEALKEWWGEFYAKWEFKGRI